MDYAKIKALAEGAIPGPYEADENHDVWGRSGSAWVGHCEYAADAAFIAACDPTTVLGMIAEIERRVASASKLLHAESDLEHVKIAADALESERDALRAEVAMLRAERDEGLAKIDAMWTGIHNDAKLIRREQAALDDANDALAITTRDRDEWRTQHDNAVALWYAERDRLAEDLTEARAQRDARPDITREDAKLAYETLRVRGAGGQDIGAHTIARDNVLAALRSHAAKMVPR